MNQGKQIITNSLEETQKFAEEFAKRRLLAKGDSLPIVITLTGELGAGKTTFTQGFAKGLGITNRIISPTFIIVRSYRIKSQVFDPEVLDSEAQTRRAQTRRESRIKGFYHIDLYRIHSERDLDSIGLKDILNEKDAVVVIEWPEKMGGLLPKKRIDIQIESLGENERKIRISADF